MKFQSFHLLAIYFKKNTHTHASEHKDYGEKNFPNFKPKIHKIPLTYGILSYTSFIFLELEIALKPEEQAQYPI